MKKLNVSISTALILVLIMAFGMVTDTVALAANSTMQGAIAVSNAQQLDNIRNNLGGNFYLTQDIDVSTLGFNWTPIGTREAPFTGTFDGHGFQITNMRVGNTIDERDDQGFFGAISGATVRNFTVNGMVIGRNYVGGVAGRVANGSLIENVTNNADIYGAWNVGGVAGFMTSGSNYVKVGYIIDSINNGNITVTRSRGPNITDGSGRYVTSGAGQAGGIVGYIRLRTTIRSAINTGTISWRDGIEFDEFGAGSLGGIVGRAGSNNPVAYNGQINVLDSANIGNVYGTSSVGGIAGSMAQSATIQRSYNSGEVVATVGVVGGLVGNARNAASISDSFNTGSVTATGYSRIFRQGGERLAFHVGGDRAGGILGSEDVSGGANITNTYNAGDVIAIVGNSIFDSHGNETLMPNGRGVGGIVGTMWHFNNQQLSSNVVLSNIITGNYIPSLDWVWVGTIVGGYDGGNIRHVVNRTINDNYAVAFVNAYRDAETTLPRAAFFKQSTWESIGFDFENVWFMPKGENALPALQWQTDNFPTMSFLSPIQHAQQIFNRLNHGGNMLMTGPDLSHTGAQNFLSFTQRIGAKRQHYYNEFRSASRIFHFQEYFISASSITLGLLLGGFSTGAVYDLSRMAGLSMPWDENTDSWIFNEALDGNRMVQDGIRDLASINLHIRNSGGAFPEDNLVMALDYIYAYYNIQMGMSSLRMGRGHFNNHMNTPPYENLIRIAAGALPLNFFGPVTGEIGEFATGEIIDLLMTGATNNSNTHITSWSIAHVNFIESMESWRHYERLVHRPSAWATAYVNRAIREGLVPRSLQANYTQAITRAEFATLAVTFYETITGRVINPDTSVSFNDTTDINVRKAAAINVIAGMGDGNFAPNNTITREQAAVMIDRLATASGRPLPAPPGMGEFFADVIQISQWARDGVQRVNAARIMTGTGNNMFSPQETFTREQSIIAVLRLFERSAAN